MKNAKVLLNDRDEYSTLDDVCCDIMCTTSSIPVEASVKGVVGGHISWNKKNSFIHCDSGYDGIPIPLSLSKITNLQVYGSKFVLVVEKEATFRDIMQSQFYKDHECIIVAGMGTPSTATRRFLKRLWDEFELPMFGLFDCDPAGIRMFLTYTVGTFQKSYDSVNLTCPFMTCQNLDDAGIKAVDDLLKEDFVTKNPIEKRVHLELEFMKDAELKAGIDALKDWFGPNWTNFLAYKINYALTEK